MDVSSDKRLEVLRDMFLAYVGAFNGPEMRPPDALSLVKLIDSLSQGVNLACKNFENDKLPSNV